MTHDEIEALLSEAAGWRMSLAYGARPNTESELKAAGVCMAKLATALRTLLTENTRLQQWVNDLQAGMYINCVYCGHRYGPDDEVPASMADVLKEHIERCPRHPMSALKAENTRLREQRREGMEQAWNWALRVARRFSSDDLDAIEREMDGEK